MDHYISWKTAYFWPIRFTRTHEGPFNIYQIIGPVHWHTGHILFFLYTPAGQVDFLRIFFLNFSWTGHIHFFTQTISVFFLALFNSSVDWALSLFYKSNCWANRYFEEGKKNAPVHQSDKFWTVPEKKCSKNATDLFQNSSWTYDRGLNKI
jgi:hypothetical protein